MSGRPAASAAPTWRSLVRANKEAMQDRMLESNRYVDALRYILANVAKPPFMANSMWNGLQWAHRYSLVNGLALTDELNTLFLIAPTAFLSEPLDRRSNVHKYTAHRSVKTVSLTMTNIRVQSYYRLRFASLRKCVQPGVMVQPGTADLLSYGWQRSYAKELATCLANLDTINDADTLLRLGKHFGIDGKKYAKRWNTFRHNKAFGELALERQKKFIRAALLKEANSTPMRRYWSADEVVMTTKKEFKQLVKQKVSERVEPAKAVKPAALPVQAPLSSVTIDRTSPFSFEPQHAPEDDGSGLKI